jgi:predicted small secreted protein
MQRMRQPLQHLLLLLLRSLSLSHHAILHAYDEDPEKRSAGQRSYHAGMLKMHLPAVLVFVAFLLTCCSSFMYIGADNASYGKKALNGRVKMASGSGKGCQEVAI